MKLDGSDERALQVMGPLPLLLIVVNTLVTIFVEGRTHVYRKRGIDEG